MAIFGFIFLSPANMYSTAPRRSIMMLFIIHYRVIVNNGIIQPLDVSGMAAHRHFMLDRPSPSRRMGVRGWFAPLPGRGPPSAFAKADAQAARPFLSPDEICGLGCPTRVFSCKFPCWRTDFS